MYGVTMAKNRKMVSEAGSRLGKCLGKSTTPSVTPLVRSCTKNQPRPRRKQGQDPDDDLYILETVRAVVTTWEGHIFPQAIQ